MMCEHSADVLICYSLQWLEDLPDQYFIGGDNAYPLSQRVLIPFSGGEVHDETKRTYNFTFRNFEFALRWHLVFDAKMVGSGGYNEIQQ